MEAHGETRPRKRANRKLNREQHKNVEVPEPEIHTRDEEEIKLRHSFSEEEEDGASLTYKILFFVLLLALGGLATIVLIDGNNSYELGKAESQYNDDNGLDDMPIQVEHAAVASSWFDWLTNEEEDHDHHHVEEFTDEPHEFHDDHDDDDDHVGGHDGHEDAGESEDLNQEQAYPAEEGNPENDYSVPEAEAEAQVMEFARDSPSSQGYDAADQDLQIPLDDEDDVNNLDSELPQSFEYVQNVIQEEEFSEAEDQIQSPPSQQQQQQENLQYAAQDAPEEESQIFPPQVDDNDDESDSPPSQTFQQDDTNGEPQADFYAPQNIDNDIDDDGDDEYLREQLLRSMGAAEEAYHQQVRRDQPNQYNPPPNSVNEEEDIFDAHEYM